MSDDFTRDFLVEQLRNVGVESLTNFNDLTVEQIQLIFETIQETHIPDEAA